MPSIFIHAVAKYWIVPLDLTDHSVHHILPKGFDWARYAYARREVGALMEREEIADQEVWGLKQAIDLTFFHLSLLPPDATLGAPESYGWIDPDLLQM